MSDKTPDEEAEDDTQNESERLEKSSTGSREEEADYEEIGSGFDFSSLFDLGSSGNVGIREGISYGLGLIVYIVGLLLITSVLSGIGAAFALGSAAINNIVITLLIGLFGFAVSLISLVLFFAGFAGLQYKIIADAVSRGNDIE